MKQGNLKRSCNYCYQCGRMCKADEEENYCPACGSHLHIEVIG